MVPRGVQTWLPTTPAQLQLPPPGSSERVCMLSARLYAGSIWSSGVLVCLCACVLECLVPVMRCACACATCTRVGGGAAVVAAEAGAALIGDEAVGAVGQVACKGGEGR